MQVLSSCRRGKLVASSETSWPTAGARLRQRHLLPPPCCARYLETASGHHWMAQRVPHHSFFITGNQGRFQEVRMCAHDYAVSTEKPSCHKDNQGCFQEVRMYTPRCLVLLLPLKPSLSLAIRAASSRCCCLPPAAVSRAVLCLL